MVVVMERSYFEFFAGGTEALSNTPFQILPIHPQPRSSRTHHHAPTILSEETGFWKHTRQYTFWEHRIPEAYQTTYVLGTTDPESIPGNIRSQDKGSWNHIWQSWQRILNHMRHRTFFGRLFWSHTMRICSYDKGFFKNAGNILSECWLVAVTYLIIHAEMMTQVGCSIHHSWVWTSWLELDI